MGTSRELGVPADRDAIKAGGLPLLHALQGAFRIFWRGESQLTAASADSYVGKGYAPC